MAKEWDLKSTSQLKAVIKQRFQIASDFTLNKTNET
jgi:hypothetical protein